MVSGTILTFKLRKVAKLSEKIGYALGDAAAGGITWKVMSIVFPFFFTNVFGLSLADTALLMLIARMFDVVTDPLMGALADRTRSRWGTYRPWLIIGAIPFGLIFALLLYTPELGPTGKRIWAYSLYLLMMAVYTAVNVPYGSLLGVMTEDDNEKNQFSAFRMVGAYAMGFITLLSFPYIKEWIGGTEQHQYAVIGALFGGLAAVMTLACGLLTRERVKMVRAEKFSFKQFADLFKNKPWLILTSIGICTNFFNGFRYAVAAYIFQYCMGGDITVMGLIINYTVFMAFGEVTCMIFGGVSPKFTEWMGSKRKAFPCFTPITRQNSYITTTKSKPSWKLDSEKKSTFPTGLSTKPGFQNSFSTMRNHDFSLKRPYIPLF